jgi:hypothetical protein
MKNTLLSHEFPETILTIAAISGPPARGDCVGYCRQVSWEKVGFFEKQAE